MCLRPQRGAFSGAQTVASKNRCFTTVPILLAGAVFALCVLPKSQRVTCSAASCGTTRQVHGRHSISKANMATPQLNPEVVTFVGQILATG